MATPPVATTLEPITPTSIRSSDESYIGNPFMYWLVRRCGIVPRFSYSEALNLGSYFHTAAEGGLDQVASWSLIQAALEERSLELSALAKDTNIPTDSLQTILDNEVSDAHVGYGLWRASLDIPYGPSRETIGQFLASKTMRCIGTEVFVQYPHICYRPLNLVAQFDALYFDEKTSLLYAFDYKTCSQSATARVQTCAAEFQTQHYLHILTQAMPSLINRFKLPPTSQAGGMIHWAIRKPAIRLSGQDADRAWSCESKRTRLRGVANRDGMNWRITLSDLKTGEVTQYHNTASEEAAIEYLDTHVSTKPKSVPDGTPKVSNYIRRVTSWMRGTEEYVAEAQARQKDPCVNRSLTRPSILDTPLARDYHETLRQIHDLATREPKPENFWANRSELRTMDENHPYRPFYLLSPDRFTQVLANRKYAVAHRE